MNQIVDIIVKFNRECGCNKFTIFNYNMCPFFKIQIDSNCIRLISMELFYRIKVYIIIILICDFIRCSFRRFN